MSVHTLSLAACKEHASPQRPGRASQAHLKLAARNTCPLPSAHPCTVAPLLLVPASKTACLATRARVARHEWLTHDRLTRAHQGTPFLYIGHHKLTGKEIKLKRPFAVLKTVKGVGEPVADAADGEQDAVVTYVGSPRALYTGSSNPLLPTRAAGRLAAWPRAHAHAHAHALALALAHAHTPTMPPCRRAAWPCKDPAKIPLWLTAVAPRCRSSSFDIVATIKKKLMFKVRPQSIINPTIRGLSTGLWRAPAFPSPSFPRSRGIRLEHSGGHPHSSSWLCMPCASAPAQSPPLRGRAHQKLRVLRKRGLA